jgi:hypothetical protein
MNVDQCYQIMTLICSKNLQQGYLSPDDFNRSINMAQRSYLDYLLGEYQQYRMQRPIPVVGFSQNQRIRDSFAPLIYGTVLTVNPATGIAPFPSDYEYVDNMWGLYGFYNIRFAQQDRQDSYIHSEIDPIEENPIYLIQHEGFHFFPENIGQTRMSYVRNPPAITWGYQLDFNGIPVYDPTTSQDPVWSDSDCLQVIVRALAIEGVSMQFGAVLQYAQEIKQTGQ